MDAGAHSETSTRAIPPTCRQTHTSSRQPITTIHSPRCPVGSNATLAKQFPCMKQKKKHSSPFLKKAKMNTSQGSLWSKTMETNWWGWDKILHACITLQPPPGIQTQVMLHGIVALGYSRFAKYPNEIRAKGYHALNASPEDWGNGPC